MDKRAVQINAVEQMLHPMSQPFDSRILDVGDNHRIYAEQCGNPNGQPVIVLHGGPGGGCNPYMRRFFDPTYYRVILFDQRGCGKSRPHACTHANTTLDLIRDIETIRTSFGIESWMVFGGSWGATLALAYAQAHPDHVDHLILRGVFLGRQSEIDWFYGGGAGQFWPDRYADFINPIPPEERGDVIAAYHRRLFSGDRALENRFAAPWLIWENSLAGLDAPVLSNVPPDYARSFARLECHYFANRCFLEEGQLLRDRHLIEHIPATIVQGRYDMVCPPRSAWALAQGWDKCDLRMIPASGHAMSEPAIAAELVSVMDDLRDLWHARYARPCN